MKYLFCVITVCGAIGLCACSSRPEMRSYVSGISYSSGPTSAHDERLRHPQFYENEADGLPAWAKVVPQSNR